MMTKETIARVFLKLALNYRAQFDNAEAVAVQNLWWQMFKGYDDEVFETAAISIINSLHYFPNVADIRKAIEELLREDSVKPAGIGGFLAATERSEPTEFGRQCAALIRRMLAGEDVSADPLYVQIRADTLAELGPFARERFPQISDELILTNEREFREAKESYDLCGRCIWDVRQCPMKGNEIVLTPPAPNGQVGTRTRPCVKRQEMKKAG
jgi:hypothetical protein